MAKFAIVVTSPSLDAQGSYSALRFIQAAIEAEHQIIGVFFYQAGVALANDYQALLSDERDELSHWQRLAKEHQIPLQVCVTAANRRGIVGPEEGQTSAPDKANLAQGFELVGIGELVSMLEQSDRSVQF